ncbi:DUF4870 domain-containing protein [Amnibacterium sp.]|uniref:DUF4870 domain-containing protein n=1 Tax=Amnibacterium sp. TaxID=1872496 RepID=UPI003F7CC9AA
MTQSQPGGVGQPLSPGDERLWSTLAHVGNIVGFLPSLLILLILGPRSARVREEAREALNFVITATIVWVALFLVGRILGALYGALPTGLDIVLLLLGFLIGFAQFAVWVIVVVLSIMAAVRVNGGGTFRYPIALRLVP